MLSRLRSHLPSTHRPRIIPTKNPGGPILIHDCTIYRARKDNGPNGDHFTREQLERMLTLAALTSKAGLPFMDTHNYLVGPIGRLHKWWFDNRDWLHGSGEVFGENVLGPERYNHIRELIRTGQFKDISLSVIQGVFENGRPNPDDVKFNEISLCRRGKHKNCNIKIVEASDQSQSYKTHHHEGEIMSLTVTHENGSTGGSLDMSKLAPSIEDMVAVAQERGVTFTQAEIDQYSQLTGENAFSAAGIILAKMADVTSMLQKQNESMKGIVKEVDDHYLAQRETDIKMAADYYEEKRAAGKLTDARAKLLTEMAAKLGKDRNAADEFDTMISGIVEAKDLAAANAELTKAVQKQTNAANRAQREQKREARDSSPKRTPITQTPAQQAAAAAAKAAAATPSPNAVAPVDAKSAPTDASANPAEMAQQLAPKMSPDGKYIMAEADAEVGERIWIDRFAPLAYQGSYAQSLPSETMRHIYEDMSKPNYFDTAVRMSVPIVGHQGFSRRPNNTPF